MKTDALHLVFGLWSLEPQVRQLYVYVLSVLKSVGQKVVNLCKSYDVLTVSGMKVWFILLFWNLWWWLTLVSTTCAWQHLFCLFFFFFCSSSIQGQIKFILSWSRWPSSFLNLPISGIFVGSDNSLCSSVILSHISIHQPSYSTPSYSSQLNPLACL